MYSLVGFNKCEIVLKIWCILYSSVVGLNKCEIQSVTYRYREFFISVLEKFGTGKKSRNRYRKNMVPELIFVAKILEFRRFLMGTGTGTGNF